MTPSTHPLLRAFSVFVVLFALLAATNSCKAAEESLSEPVLSPRPSTNETPAPTLDAAECERTVKANVVVLDQILPMNRLGAQQNTGQIFALARDVVPTSAPVTMNGWDGGPYTLDQLKTAGGGNVRLRSGKRPRPIVLRANIGDCLEITFTNLLNPLNNLQRKKKIPQ